MGFNLRANYMTDFSKRKSRKPGPDGYPTPVQLAQDGLPFGPDAADTPIPLNVQANSPTASDGQANVSLSSEKTVRPLFPDTSETSPIINPFDPDRIRIGTNYGDLAAIRSAELTFPVWTRPPKTAWFRTHPENEVAIFMLDLTADDSDGLYYLDQPLYPKLVHEPTVGLRLLVQCQTRQGTNFFWAIKLKGPFDKRENPWTTSALKERELARSKWVRHRSNREMGAYDPLVSDAIDAKADWPARPFAENLEIALKDRLISSLDHPLLVELLRGK
jgi:hypothetical protein